LAASVNQSGNVIICYSPIVVGVKAPPPAAMNVSTPILLKALSTRGVSSVIQEVDPTQDLTIDRKKVLHQYLSKNLYSVDL
jgi:hypothetical protein